MTNFFSDLWHDLREKRLWPVAVALVAALVAVPVVLSKPSETPPPAPTPESEARIAPEPRELAGLADVKLEGMAASAGSSLDTYDPSNPFRPPSSVTSSQRQDAEGAGPGSGGGADSAPGGSAGDTSAPAGGGGTVDVGGGDTGGGDTGGGDTGDTGDTGDGGTTTTTQYVYVIDVTFKTTGRTRRIKGMDRLAMLPSEASPLLLFLGVSAGGGNAVFLVDSTLQAAGEGVCKPSGEDCAFLHLGPGSEHEFTNDEGDSYTLRVDEIRRVKVAPKPAAAASALSRRTAARAAVGRPERSRRFIPPFLTDLVSVSTATAGDSSTDQDRR